MKQVAGTVVRNMISFIPCLQSTLVITQQAIFSYVSLDQNIELETASPLYMETNKVDSAQVHGFQFKNINCSAKLVKVEKKCFQKL